jgi:hypothetical protein
VRSASGTAGIQIVSGVLGSAIALAVLVGSSAADPDGGLIFLVTAVGVAGALLAFWAVFVRRGLSWRWYHTVPLGVAGALVALAITTAILVPGDPEAMGFAVGAGLSMGGLLGIAASLLLYGFRGPTSSQPPKSRTG